jgi:hypothetical protein
MINMKITKILLVIACLFCLGGCIDIDEEIDITSIGSGQWITRMDMSQLLDIMQNYVGKEEMEKQLPNKVMDTTIFFKNILDTVKNVTPEKKALLKDAKVSMKLNIDQKMFKTKMDFPFKNLTDLQKLSSSMSDGSLGMQQLMKGLGSGKTDDAMAGNMQGPDLTQFNSIYDFTIKDGLISRKLNAEKWKSFQNNPQFGQMKEATNMGMEIPYTITMNLPRAVKKIDNALAKLSDDKKTVTLKYNLIEVFDHPEKFEYTVVY